MLVQHPFIPSMTFRVELFRSEADGMPYHDTDGGEGNFPGAFGKGFEGSEDTHRLNRGAGLGDDKTDARLAGLQLAVGRAGSLREKDDAVA